MHCILFLALICHPLQHKAELILTSVQAAAMITDGVYTAKPIGVETDPITRPLIGLHPTWSRMAPIGFTFIISTSSLAEKTRHSNSWIKHLWWLPQAINIAGNTAGIEISKGVK